MRFFNNRISTLFNLSTKLLTIFSFSRFFAVIAMMFLFFTAQAQDPVNTITNDSVKIVSDTIKNDSIIDLRKQESPDAIKTKIDYKAKDSIIMNLDDRKSYLFREVKIDYEDITLKSGYVEIDFQKNQLFAEGLKDSAGKEIERPEYEQGENSFTSRSMYYNFDTRKGLVKDIFTNEGESYLHGSIVKRFPDGKANFKKGAFTTCSLENPHYQIRFSKARMIPNDKFVSGPAYMEIEHVPTPLVLPFGYFPNKRGQISGIIIPTWGESANRGFYFERGGYYWGINDYLDMIFQGDIYTRGSWALYLTTNYKKRYKYDGSLKLSYAVNVISQKFLPDYNKYKDFSVEWSHKQDPKARPNSSFSAQVKMASSSFYKFNPSSTNDYLSNTFESSIAYQTSLFGGKSNLSLNLGSRQNVNTKELQLWLPQVNFSVNTFYPFRKKNKTGAMKWWDNINVNYSLNAQNYINTYDSLVLTSRIWDMMQNGIQHTLQVRNPIKLLKFISWNNSVNFVERWYFQSVNQQWFNGVDTSYIKKDTIRRFQMAHEINIASQLSTKIYGIFRFKKGALQAIRHVLTPSVTFGYHPDYGSKTWGYYKYAQIDSAGRTMRYSIFQNGIYGTPPDGLSGKVSFNLNNNLEMKVRSKKDTVTGSKMIVLLDYLNVGSGYDFAKDSLRWDYLSLNIRTRLFNRLDVSFNGAWDPYVIDTNGNRLNQFEWKVNHRLFRRQNTSWIMGISYSLSDNDFKKKDKKTNEKKSVFLNKWNLSMNLNFSYSSRFDYRNISYIPDTVLTVMVNGEFYITPKWRVNFTTGYDFKSKDFSYTSLSIHRDLHCWEMFMEWVPYGFRKSYNFTIRIKSSMLKDLKLTRKSDWRDNF